MTLSSSFLRPPGTDSRIPDILVKYERDMLPEWVSLQLAASTLRRDLMKEDELREQSRRFLQLLSRTMQSGGTAMGIDTPAWREIRELLTEVSTTRARQGFTPSETATFVLSLKQPLFARIRQDLGRDAEALANETWTGTVLLDKLGLFTTEVFQKGREEVIVRQQREAEDALREVLAREQLARTTAEVANRAKDEFLAMLSHELRSPLNAILTWVTLLRGGRLDAVRTARALEAIERNTRLQTTLIDDLLDVSRIVSGKMRLDIGLVELPAVVEAALESARPAAAAKGIRLDVDIDPTLGPLPGDAARLQQIVWNLLSNAIKFTPNGGRVTLRVDAPDSQARIEVTDTGPGIDPAFLPHIFERFRQADSSASRPEAGLGLGLAIVRHLAELHGGTVEARSAGLGHGATFMVRLPLPAVRVQDDGGDAFREPAVPQLALQRLKVLVVDDDRDSRDAISAVLEQGGASVTTAGSASEAIASLGRTAFDVMVSDIAMPGEDGYALIERLRQGAAGAEGVPVLAVTAYAGAANRGRILASGYDAYLPKPVDARELVAVVRRLATRGRPV